MKFNQVVSKPLPPESNEFPLEDMTFNIQKISVQAKSRTLQVTYTMEPEKDIEYLHSEDAEDVLSEEIKKEVDNTVYKKINRMFRRIFK